MRYSQTTLCGEFRRSGIGIHTGAPATVTARPAAAGHGIQFRCGRDPVPAAPEFVISTRRNTTLGCGDSSVATVEHLLSALHGLQVDNADILVEGPEIPILDGSAKGWVEAILESGIQTLSETGRCLEVRKPAALLQGTSAYVVSPGPRLSLTCVTQFDHPLLGTDAVYFAGDPEAYAREIAPARTFAIREEVEMLLAGGLARGGSLDNALIVETDRFSSPLRLENECARHKLLDLMGDLALAGRRLQASITVIRPSHQGNTALAALLVQNQEG